MSYIHEALRKAQVERDHRYRKYSGILAARGKETRLLTWRWIVLTMTFGILAFASYWWVSSNSNKPAPPLDSRGKKPDGEMIREFSGGPDSLYERAKALQREGRLEDAKHFYQETLKADPGYIEALNNLAVIYIAEKDYAGARSTFEKVILLRPDCVDSYYNLACVYAIQGEVYKSLVHLKKAILLDPSARDWARTDTDLENLRGIAEFEEMVGDGQKANPVNESLDGVSDPTGQPLGNSPGKEG